MTARGWGSSRQTLRKAENSTRRRLADGATEQRPLGCRVEAAALLHDVGHKLPCPGTCERRLSGLGIELIEQLRPELDEEESLGRDSVRGSPFAPVGRVDLELEVDEARGQRGRHAVGDAAVALAIAAGHDRGAFRELVLPALAVADELEEGRLHHGHGGGELLQVDEPEVGAVRGRQEVGGRPAGAVVAVAPGDAAHVDGIEQQRADVAVAAAAFGGDLLRELALAAAGRSPDHHGLSGFDEDLEGGGELARPQRVVGGDGVGFGHGRLRMAGRWRGRLWSCAFDRTTARALPPAVSGRRAGRIIGGWRNAVRRSAARLAREGRRH